MGGIGSGGRRRSRGGGETNVSEVFSHYTLRIRKKCDQLQAVYSCFPLCSLHQKLWWSRILQEYSTK